MSIQITIKSKTFFKNNINFKEMADKLNLKFGVYNSKFELLVDNSCTSNKITMFNPKKIGTGIYIDSSYRKKGVVVIIIQDYIPKNEIEDTYKIINFICKIYKKFDVFINDEFITLGVLEELKEKIIEVSFNNLKVICKKTIDSLSHLRLALFQIELTEEIKEKFSYSMDSEEFQNYIHEKQKEKYYGS